MLEKRIDVKLYMINPSTKIHRIEKDGWHGLAIEPPFLSAEQAPAMACRDPKVARLMAELWTQIRDEMEARSNGNH